MKKTKNTDEVYAAIAYALHLYQEENEAHDKESLVITIGHLERPTSPWSSKILTLRQTPVLNRNNR